MIVVAVWRKTAMAILRMQVRISNHVTFYTMSNAQP
jgi:hypothetical protein